MPALVHSVQNWRAGLRVVPQFRPRPPAALRKMTKVQPLCGLVIFLNVGAPLSGNSGRAGSLERPPLWRANRFVDILHEERGVCMKTDSIRVSAVIPAEPKVIYEAWMSSKGHGAMTGSGAKITARVGGAFSAWDGYISGKTLELKPGSRILQSWRTTDFAEDEPDSSLEVLFAKSAGGTRVTLVHTKIPAGHGAEYRKGWIDFYFTPMKGYFASKQRRS